MYKLVRTLLASALLIGISATAYGQTRTWVSGVGDDLNPCSRTAPCKTFAGAISKTSANGEISTLDPGGFGTVTITKSITINGTGTLSSILAAGTNGVNVNDSLAAVPNSAVVILRDISINGANTGFDGIRYLSGKSLMVDHCWIYGFNGNGVNSDGIDVNKSTTGVLKVVDSIIDNVSGDGIHLTTSSSVLVAFLDHVRVGNCGQDGIDAVTNVRGSISNSQIEVANGNGIVESGANSQLNLDDVAVSFVELSGLKSFAGSSIRVSDSIIANNATGMTVNGGSIDSFQGNSVFGNVSPGSGFSSTTNKQ
jgi:hypothetical protein